MKIIILKVDYKTSIEEQLKELEIDNYLNLDYVKDIYKPSKDPCLYEVEDGEAMLNISPLDVRDKFAKEDRRGLTILEGLALYRHDKTILKRHYLDLVGTRYRGGAVPSLCVRVGEPALAGLWEDRALPKYGAPSIGSVSELDSRNLDSLGSLELRVQALEDWRDKLNQAWNGK